jgi:hypothetical protein
MRIEDGIYLGNTGTKRTPAFIIPGASTSYKLLGKGRKVDQTLKLARDAREKARVQGLIA